LGDDLGRKFREQFVGETCEVLLEDAEPASGRCERYFMVNINESDQRLVKNQIIKAIITNNDDDEVVGKIDGKH
jgi:tRNA A37 methylthiotransferase MiaB